MVYMVGEVGYVGHIQLGNELSEQLRLNKKVFDRKISDCYILFIKIVKRMTGAFSHQQNDHKRMLEILGAV